MHGNLSALGRSTQPPVDRAIAPFSQTCSSRSRWAHAALLAAPLLPPSPRWAGRSLSGLWSAGRNALLPTAQQPLRL
eukprot:8170722-Alexandrium_andersonii.AAC.2